MLLKITCLPFDERAYSVDTGSGTRFIKAPELKQWLLDMGVGDSTVGAVLDIAPNETITIKIAEKAA